MFRGFGSIFYKEVIQISRDPITLLLMLVVPMIQLAVFGYAINTDVRDIKTAVYNLDVGRQSRELLAAFENTDYFMITQNVASDEELNNAIVSGKAKVGIKIPPDYSDRLATNRQATVLVLIDGSDSSIASQSLQVASAVGLTESLRRMTSGVESRTSNLPIEIRPKMLFNPDSRSANFMVPGLIAIILQVITTMLTAFSIVREREFETGESRMIEEQEKSVGMNAGGKVHGLRMSQERQKDERGRHRHEHRDQREPGPPLDHLLYGGPRVAELHDRDHLGVEARIDGNAVVHAAAIHHGPGALNDERLIAHHVEDLVQILRTVRAPRHGADRHEQNAREHQPKDQRRPPMASSCAGLPTRRAAERASPRRSVRAASLVRIVPIPDCALPCL